MPLSHVRFFFSEPFFSYFCGMQNITVHIINPKAKNLLNHLADMDLISIEKEIKYSKEHLAMLDKDYENFEKGIGKDYSMEEFFKAKKLLNDLGDMDLISIEKTNKKAHSSDDKEFMLALEKDAKLYEQGKLKTYSLEEVKAKLAEKQTIK